MTSSTADCRPERDRSHRHGRHGFPAPNSVSAFWRNLRSGVESIVDLSEEDLLAAGVSEGALANRAYVRRAALMTGSTNSTPTSSVSPRRRRG